MHYLRLYNYLRFAFCATIITCLFSTYSLNAQTLKGKVYAFKDLQLNVIKVKSTKSGNIAYTANDGSFSLQCHPKDKIVFSGNGFERTSESYTNDSVFVKMIFKGGSRNREQAINNEHADRDQLLFSVKYESAYNCYPSPRKIYNSTTKKRTLQYTHINQKYSHLNRTQGDYEFSLLEEK